MRHFAVNPRRVRPAKAHVVVARNRVEIVDTTLSGHDGCDVVAGDSDLPRCVVSLYRVVKAVLAEDTVAPWLILLLAAADADTPIGGLVFRTIRFFQNVAVLAAELASGFALHLHICAETAEGSAQAAQLPYLFVRLASQLLGLLHLLFLLFILVKVTNHRAEDVAQLRNELDGLVVPTHLQRIVLVDEKGPHHKAVHAGEAPGATRLICFGVAITPLLTIVFLVRVEQLLACLRPGATVDKL